MPVKRRLRKTMRTNLNKDINMFQEKPAWSASVLTLFPEMFPGSLGHSLAGKALKNGIWELETIDIREFADDKHRTVDDAPFGGGAGMVIRPDVVDAALDAALQRNPKERDVPLIYLTPRGVPLCQTRVKQLAAEPSIILLCGRYEGVDERVLKARKMEEISLGDYLLSGGEPAAIALIDACVRLLPNVVGSKNSLVEESFEEGLIEYPQFTRPQTWHGQSVPDVLTSGHHEKIKTWRRAQAKAITKERRPDLWARYRNI